MRNLVLLFLCLPLFSSAQNLEIKSSEVTFTIKNAGITVEGSFGDVSGTVVFNPDKYFSGKVDVSVAANTINTGIGARDSHLKKEEYFDVKNYPKIQITSRFFGKKDDGYTAYLTLKMKGKTGNITMPFTYSKSGDDITIEGSFTLDRRDYNVGGSSFIMGDEVTVKIKLVCQEGSKGKRNPLKESPSKRKARNASLIAITSKDI